MDELIINELYEYGIKVKKVNDEEFNPYKKSINYNRYVINNGIIDKLFISDEELDENILKNIFKLKNIKSLYLRNNQITKIPEEIAQLYSLESLHLGNNSICKIPLIICNLSNLKILSLYANKVKIIPKEIIQLQKLETLNLKGNLIEVIPKETFLIKSLENLYLSGNPIQYFEKLTNRIKVLLLDHSDLKKIPEGIECFQGLEELDISYNSIEEFPQEFYKLNKLKKLLMAGNVFFKIDNELSNLENLEQLSLNNNNLTRISSGITNLRKLKKLKINRNKLKEIPNNIRDLTSLENFTLQDNQIYKISKYIPELNNLEILNLNSNKISMLPNSFSNFKNLKKIHLKNNSIINNLKEIESLSTMQKISYLLSVQKQITRPINEIKILVVGEERVGKTSLINRIVHNSYDDNTSSTMGIDINNFILSNGIKSNIWDFAGQEITHQTHQFFLTTRSLYLYILDAQKEDDYSIYNWLETIHSNSNKSPIIVVVNKNDLNSSFEFDVHRYNKEFNIVDVIYTSAKNDNNISKLIDSIELNASKLEHINDQIPENWFIVKNLLEDYSTNKDYIERNTFDNICLENEIKKELDRNTLLKILNEIGTVVYYENRRLNNVQILNPTWVTNAVYSIIRSSFLNEDATLEEKNFTKIFENNVHYNRRHFTWLIDLLNQFEVSFPISDEKVLIPSRLSQNQPDIKLTNTGLKFRFFYEKRLKKSIISQFIVKIYRYIDIDQDVPYWRRGIFLKYNDCRVVVIADENKKTINISFDSDTKEAREFLSIIRHIFKEIHSDTIYVKEEIPLIIKNEIVGYKDYSFLVELEKNGMKEVPLEIKTPEKFHTFRISDLLDGYNESIDISFDHEELKKDIIAILLLESENRNTIFTESEDEINDRIRTGLINRKYYTNDQSRGGDSSTGKKSGERDILVRNKKDGYTESILEALVLENYSKDKIVTHYDKLIKKYDTVGNKINYMLTYAKNEDFTDLWIKYKANFPNISVCDSQKNNLKIGTSTYKECVIYHLFMNFYSYQ